MTVYRYITPIQTGTDDGHENNYSGTSINSTSLNLGTWLFGSEWHIGFRFPIYAYPKSTINFAYLYLYWMKWERPFASDYYPFNAMLYITDEVNARPVSYGITSRPNKTSVTWYFNSAPPNYSWIQSPDISNLITAAVNQTGFNFGNYQFFKMSAFGFSGNNKQLVYIASYDQNPNLAAYLDIQYEVFDQSMSDTLSIGDHYFDFSGNTPIDNTKIMLDNIELHTESIDHLLPYQYMYDSRERKLPQKFELSERLSFNEAYHLENLQGKNVPLVIYGKPYNCVLYKCEFTFRPTFVESVLYLEVDE